jgi:protein-disulfide isomerase
MIARRASLIAGVGLLAGLLVLLAACNFPAAPADAGPTPTLTPLPTLPPLVNTLPPPEALDEGEFDATDYAQGPEDAPVTIIHYGDFQCAPCADVARSLAILLDRYPDDLRVIWRHYPDTVTHDKAALALVAAEAAGEQGRFWEMHDLLFNEQANWTGLSLGAFKVTLIAYASTLELDVARFQAALDQPAEALVDHYRMQALALDIMGIPALLINGQPYSGRYDLYGLDEAVRFYALGQRQYAENARHGDRPGEVVQRGARHRARRDHDRPVRRPRPGDRQQLRLPGARGLVRQHHLPPRDPRPVRPDRRSERDGPGRPRLQHPGRERRRPALRPRGDRRHGQPRAGSPTAAAASSSSPTGRWSRATNGTGSSRSSGS